MSKILFVLNSGFDTPGPSNHLLENIIEKILLKGDKVHIIAKHKTGLEEDIPDSLKKYNSLSINLINVKNVKKENLIKRYLEDIKYSISCIKFYKRNRDVDRIFIQSSYTSVFLILLSKFIIKKELIYNVQDIWPINAAEIGILKRNSFLFKFLRKSQKIAYNKADKIITISEDMKDTLIKEGVSEEKIFVIYNWTYTDDIINIDQSKNRFIKKYDINKELFKVVYAGNMGNMQNVEMLIDVANLMKDYKKIHFYLIGNGVKKDYYLKKVENYGLSNISFFDMESKDMAKHIYSMADINIISLCKGIIKTALPSKTAICLSCSKPIIACIDIDSKFSSMLSKCESCFVIEPNDIKGLYDKIIYNFDNNLLFTFEEQYKLFEKNFLKEINSEKYASIILS